MKRQASLMDVTVIVLLAVGALIGIYTASGQVALRGLPAIQNVGRTVNTAVEQEAAAPANTVDMWDASGKYRAAPAVGDVWQERGYYRTAETPAAAADSSAPLVERQYRTVPAASGVEETSVLPDVNVPPAAELAPHKSMVTTTDGAQQIDYLAPWPGSSATVKRVEQPTPRAEKQPPVE